jgi:hypothetical protein
MNKGLEEVESSKESKRWLVIVIIFTWLCWIKVWVDFAFGYISWTGSLTIVYAILPGFFWVAIARRYNKIDQRLANLSAVVLSVVVCILLALHVLSPIF